LGIAHHAAGAIILGVGRSWWWSGFVLAHHVHDLSDLTRLSHLTGLAIGDAPLANGVAAAIPILDQLTSLAVWRVPTATSLDALAGSSLESLNLFGCPVTDLTPLASLPHLRGLTLMDMNEPVDLSPLAQTHHRLRIELRNTPTVADPGPLVKVQRR
jgi:Leucine-rich repeat (LRR) protein